VSAHTEALARLVEQGYTAEQAHAIVDRFGGPKSPPVGQCGGEDGELRCERLSHEGACCAAGVLWQSGSNIVADLVGPPRAVMPPPRRRAKAGEQS
jgi:hypothetical protein